MRWYCTSLATASDAFGTEYERINKSWSESFFPVSFKAALRSFPPGFRHNIHIFLSYGEKI